MARPQRNNVDYFPHYISDGKKMFFIEQKYGNDGYAMWFKLLETLAITDYHYLNLSDETEQMFLAAKCRVDVERLLEFINDLSKLKEINSAVWNECNVVWSDKFMESISDAYSKRSNNCMSLEGLRSHLLGLGILKGDVKPQSKVKETKVKEIKVEYTKPKKNKVNILMSKANALDVTEKNRPFFKIAHSFYELFRYNSTEQLNVEWKHLEDLKAESACNDIRLAIEQDNRTEEDFRIVWAFLKNDDFWMQNIQSTKKLREKFDQLITKAKNQNNGKSKSFSEEANKFLAENDPDYKNY